jgi:hypothetical protein
MKSLSWEMRYERLALWADAEWQQRNGQQPYQLLWAAESCGNQLAQSRVKPRRRLKGKAYFTGTEQVRCPDVISISEYVVPGRQPMLGETVGAFIFSFDHPDGAFEVLFVSSYFRDDDPNIVRCAGPTGSPRRLGELRAVGNEAVRAPPPPGRIHRRQ